MPTKPEDVSVAWGQQRSQADMAMEKWWLAIFQDMVPSSDGTKLYFLHDASVDGKGNYQCIAVFDPYAKRFLRDIPLNIHEGRVKYFYLVKPNELALFVQNESDDGSCILWMFSLIISPDGMDIGPVRCVVQSLSVGADWIISQALDTIVLISGPGLMIWRLSTDRGVMFSYAVPGANIQNYFDATVFGGVIYLFPGLRDENLDFTHVHTIDMEGRTPMRPFSTRADPFNGYPAVRKQCGLDVWQGRLFVVGGQLDDPNRGTFRYGDMWALDLRTLQWQRYGLQLPLLIIEPRIHINEKTGLCFLWGDCDLSRGCYTTQRHFHALRFYMGVAPLQESIWARLTRAFPQLLRTPYQYLRDVLRIPDKFLQRIAPLQQQQGHPGGAYGPQTGAYGQQPGGAYGPQGPQAGSYGGSQGATYGPQGGPYAPPPSGTYGGQQSGGSTGYYNADNDANYRGKKKKNCTTM